ncbi:MAG: TIM barrel protein [Motiliproteus sp.]|nr:TIM barrel protein [Motiliproteus sp.]MCW9053909.1 TIM barrel protein [Motiliproteus sp.]
MPRFSANLSLLFTEVPLLERFREAASSGFKAVEIQFPYELDIDTISDQLQRYDLQLDLINFPAGDWQTGDRGIACDPNRKQEFIDAVDQATSYAKALQCPQINCLAGIPPESVDQDQALSTLRENLQYADQKLGQDGIRLNIEAINTEDVPGFFLHHSDQVVALIQQWGLSNSYLQYDAYHMQIMEGALMEGALIEGALIETIRRLSDKIGHIQIADTPGRHQPGTGTIDFPNLFKALDIVGYTGWVALEYNPLGETKSSLDWMNAYVKSQ